MEKYSKTRKSATRGIKSELNVGLDMLRSAMDGRSDSCEPKMKIFNQCGEMDFIPDSFASALLADCKPDWIPLDLYFEITDSLIGFDPEMALVIADDIIDCWSGRDCTSRAFSTSMTSWGVYTPGY